MHSKRKRETRIELSSVGVRVNCLSINLSVNLILILGSSNFRR